MIKIIKLAWLYIKLWNAKQDVRAYLELWGKYRLMFMPEPVQNNFFDMYQEAKEKVEDIKRQIIENKNFKEIV